MSLEGHTEQQIMAVLQLVPAGQRVADIRCKVATRSSNLLPVEEPVRRLGERAA